MTDDLGTVLRTGALLSLQAAAQQTPADPDYAALANAQVGVGAVWPAQSSTPGAPAMPPQIRVYGWEHDGDTDARNTGDPSFTSLFHLTVEVLIEVKGAPPIATLPDIPTADEIAAAVDGQVDLLTFAVLKAVLTYLNVVTRAMGGGKPVINGFASFKRASKYSELGQRIPGNGVVLFSIECNEHFPPFLDQPLTDLVILYNPKAGGVANQGNAGNGTISTVAVGIGVQPGTYAVVFTSATGFTVTAPDSTSAGAGTVGASFTGGGVTFLIAAGSAPFAAGDGFAVIVQVPTETVLDLSP